MEETKKEKKGISGIVVFLIVLIAIVVAAPLGYILGNKYLSNNENINKNINVTVDNTNDNISNKSEQSIELDVDDPFVITLFSNTRSKYKLYTSEKIFTDGLVNMSETDFEYKVKLAANIFFNSAEYDTVTMKSFYSEEQIKNAIEQIFGPDSYTHYDEINLPYCKAKYDTTTKKYSGVCIGDNVTNTEVEQKIISATKYDDRIEIVAAAATYFGEEDNTLSLYADTTLTNKVGSVSTWSEIDNFIGENADKLEHYKYTFTESESGAYYYTKAERVN